MKKLYIDQQGIVKLVDVPEEPKFIDTMEYVENCLNDKAMKEYKKALASAKEAGIEVADQEHGKEIICYELYGGPQVDIPWSVTVKNWSDEIFGTHYKLTFDSSWNELMPVVEKIESMDHPAKSLHDYFRFGTAKDLYWCEFGRFRYTSGASLIDAFWNVAAEYVKWYLEQ